MFDAFDLERSGEGFQETLRCLCVTIEKEFSGGMPAQEQKLHKVGKGKDRCKI